jgi:ABC-type branched-subunit amino acid transport system ATPase component
VSLEVRENEVVALLGRNGAGKSSTFKSIMGIVQPRSGTVAFYDQTISGRSPEQIARLGVGLVPQGRRLFAGLTVEENLRLGALSRSRGTGVHWERDRIYSYFPRIREKLHTRADQLSGGEQQMVAIARALSGNVKILMLAEHFGGLSSRSSSCAARSRSSSSSTISTSFCRWPIARWCWTAAVCRTRDRRSRC